MTSVHAIESTRVDRWLWSVRAFKTRSLATDAVRAGHVTVNRGATKPATGVKVGDTVRVKLDGWERVLEVVQVIDRRVGAAVAVQCFVDHSPPRPSREEAVVVFARDPSAGRPTKRDRRQLDRLRRG